MVAHAGPMIIDQGKERHDQLSQTFVKEREPRVAASLRNIRGGDLGRLPHPTSGETTSRCRARGSEGAGSSGEKRLISLDHFRGATTFVWDDARSRRVFLASAQK